jgi:hypothetical protein
MFDRPLSRHASLKEMLKLPSYQVCCYNVIKNYAYNLSV